MTTTHPTDAQLNELADGTLTASERERIQRHVAECVPCTATVRGVQALVQRSRALPREVPPPSGAWSAIREAARRSDRAAIARARGMRWPMLAAAAALVAVSSATTFWLTDGRRETSAPIEERGAETPATLAAFAPVEARYVVTTTALRETLDERRATLDPATIATVERSLTTIDEAIAEARAALARDPADATLTRLLASSYEQKVTLLRRASELPPRS
jgi:anti-sigma factor RsiW